MYFRGLFVVILISIVLSVNFGSPCIGKYCKNKIALNNFILEVIKRFNKENAT